MEIGVMTRTKSVTSYGVTFDVEYSASAGRAGTYWEPPEPAELEIENIYIAGQELTELLQQCVLDDIYERLDSGLDDDKQQAEEDAAEALAAYRNERMERAA
jgi:hypothetical protein